MDFPFPTFSREMTSFSRYMGNGFTFSLCSSLDLPVDSKIEDLLTLTGKEIESVPDEKMEHQGSSLLKEHQHLMLQHFGSEEMSILPDHVIHRMLVGVSVYLSCSLNFGSPFGISFFFSHYPSFSFSSSLLELWNSP